MIAPMYKSEGGRTKCNNYRDIILFSVVGKIYAGILVDRVCRVIEDEQRGFRAGRKGRYVTPLGMG